MPKRMYWKKKNALARRNFNRRFAVAFIPKFTLSQEITTEDGSYLVREVSVLVQPENQIQYIITEQ